MSVSSKVSRPAITAPFRLICLWQEFPKSLYRRMFMDFRSHLQMSLNRSCGLPAGRFPSASSPHRVSFGILPPSILQTYPSHRMRRCFNREYMLGRFALSRTSVSVGNYVLPGDVQNASEVAQVEDVEFVLMQCM